MSAYQCSNEHINALVNAAVRPIVTTGGTFSVYHKGERKLLTDHELGKLLTEENDKSIMARYGSRGEADVPEFVRQYDPFKQPLTPVQVLKLCNGYIYQACEHEEWEDSLARAVVMDIKERYTRLLPGYDEASWSL